MTEEHLQQLYAQLEALLNAPVLRHCLIPTCRAEFDVRAAATGQAPARASWSGEGWLLLGAGTVIAEGGHICPEHSDLIQQHRPHREGPAPDGRFSVRCGCGQWTSSPHGWHQVLRALWEEHLLVTTGQLPALGSQASGPG
ncbi:hypothetical protein ACWD0J_20790 [Streptomyces sp. NPDC003011]